MNLTQQLQELLAGNCAGRLAAAVRCLTTYNPGVTQADVVKAAQANGIAAGTARIQFNKARREDAEMDRWQSTMQVERRAA